MAVSELSGRAQTVTGTVSPDTLGPAMTHEHLLIDMRFMFELPAEASARFRALQPLSMENLGWIRYNWTGNKDNLTLLSEKTAIEEARRYMMAGGGTLVDATTIGIARDPLALARISRATGLNIVMGAGYYVGASHPDYMDGRTDGELARQMIDEITTGVGETQVKAGIIGEIGCTWPLTDNERKVLHGAAQAQQETGAAILIHPGRDQEAPREILEILAEAGADVGRVVMGHLDRTMRDFDKILDLADSGCYLEYDLFGLESSHYPLSDIDMPSDAQRIDILKKLLDAGHRDQLVVAQDICTKHRLVKYGGHGYAHIVENIAPRMRRRGYTDEDVDAILVDNPARVLTFE